MANTSCRSARADVYARITDEIIAAVEAGTGECRMPWHHDGASTARPTNVASGRSYRGINTLILWVAAAQAGYTRGQWGTYRAWHAVGAQVRRGERATTVVLWKQLASRSGETKDDADGDDDGGRRRPAFARAFSVFNVAQTDGYEAQPVPVLPESERFQHAETFIGNLGIKTVFEGDEAYYRPSTDTVFMPPFDRFRDAASLYGVWLHELGHGSAAPHRCNRDLSGRFGSAGYALEEVTVEILSGLVLADLGIAHRPRPEHAAYIASWLEALKDPRAIFTAAAKAQQAADWMHAQQPEVPDPELCSSALSAEEEKGRLVSRQAEAGREAPGRPVAETFPWPSRNRRSP
jgi:antirestriction protein ArdC